MTLIVVLPFPFRQRKVGRQFFLVSLCFSCLFIQLHNYAFLAVRQHPFSADEKRSQILASEDLVLRAIRFGSYGDKIWFFRPEDMAAFLPISNCYDYQVYTKDGSCPCPEAEYTMCTSA